jgi:hypothetical protein
MRRTWTSHFEQLEGVAMTTQHGEAVKQHEAVKAEELTKEEREAKERESHAEKLRAKARAEEEKRRKAAEELAGKETVKGKIVRLLGELRGGVVGTARRRVLDELEGAAGRLKSEQLMGELTAEEEKEKKEREKAEKEAKAAEEKAAKVG